ncbi:glycosyltransferase [Pseudomonas sp. P155]|uniref:Glycosyltransferase n=1 Tax=Pseudomonas neuropathica TaxID=2730425 RepID=A0ABS0BJ01_9PSED|nr:glycosyltransferase [Pseudomonas neuropathica]MBF6033288.1 glycosyltransferase [Pseudomonas neuropathica]
MKQKKILMIVERNFYSTHIGVRRVIRYHWHQLAAQGHNLTLATPHQGRLCACSKDDAKAMMSDIEHSSLLMHSAPDWAKGNPVPNEAPIQSTTKTGKIYNCHWDDPKEIRLEDFDESILTTPWMCSPSGSVPEGQYTMGFVYDMVPNLLAIGALRMPRFLNAYHFAHEHSIGYDFYIKNVQKIICISESTKNDFISFYGKSLEPRLEICIPFKDFGNTNSIESENRDYILLVNVLDHRKNFIAVSESLKKAAAQTDLKIIVVGRERMPFKEVTRFLQEISSISSNVEWYRSPSDQLLASLMKKAKVLFFPSIYEGLGLPILEAQAQGIPVISSNNSSCGEINQNPTLTADPYDHDGFASKIVGVINNTQSILHGGILTNKQNSFLENRNKLLLD